MNNEKGLFLVYYLLFPGNVTTAVLGVFNMKKEEGDEQKENCCSFYLVFARGREGRWSRTNERKGNARGARVNLTINQW